ncbi:hypothetical protein RFI_18396 [Reticulomyxa filosa]|uniref:Uncharacterized protein n=1 Tax=Reticulomyxa filosa TaxID=46433 RepID=X6MYZ5_RETFI|nr:hypothetical protein RFI_18396 [Reticulomyxa filosa]|eukprot:ETO18848.1 hypothetical protein RFI_18396 [Reticulomyxa filosa]
MGLVGCTCNAPAGDSSHVKEIRNVDVRNCRVSDSGVSFTKHCTKKRGRTKIKKKKKNGKITIALTNTNASSPTKNKAKSGSEKKSQKNKGSNGIEKKGDDEPVANDPEKVPTIWSPDSVQDMVSEDEDSTPIRDETKEEEENEDEDEEEEEEEKEAGNDDDEDNGSATQQYEIGDEVIDGPSPFDDDAKVTSVQLNFQKTKNFEH